MQDSVNHKTSEGESITVAVFGCPPLNKLLAIFKFDQDHK